ncbi:hypothetical protein LZ496_04550 [Sphingomonas sp. NSE70-1]|uniref:Uncharacterized protein n=1 Tax=Sphingomonas caseinilyticus TaxID=2908205 RepID=A0ABT0RT88_9SPHN|nr:hypothetical protein [Sphingomonas caseinilyticus]MCL6698056.1 hypothetical protein [Sphingomonas caseinilyticus]
MIDATEDPEMTERLPLASMVAAMTFLLAARGTQSTPESDLAGALYG